MYAGTTRATGPGHEMQAPSQKRWNPFTDYIEEERASERCQNRLSTSSPFSSALSLSWFSHLADNLLGNAIAFGASNSL